MPSGAAVSTPVDVKSVLDWTRSLLDCSQPELALEMLEACGCECSAVTDAKAVCLLRLGYLDRATEMLQAAVFGPAESHQNALAC